MLQHHYNYCFHTNSIRHHRNLSILPNLYTEMLIGLDICMMLEIGLDMCMMLEVLLGMNGVVDFCMHNMLCRHQRHEGLPMLQHHYNYCFHTNSIRHHRNLSILPNLYTEMLIGLDI